MTQAITELARAKINLTLHVTGQRPDGYHLLESLVVFAEFADEIQVSRAGEISLSISGVFADKLTASDDNSVLKAANWIASGDLGAKIELTKVLPVSSGIGGGSADCAATIRALSRLWSLPVDRRGLIDLGADVPVCFANQPSRMSGIGEVVEPISKLPKAWLVLINSGCPISTPQVFAKLQNKENEGLGDIPEFFSVEEMAQWLRLQRNDLEAPAKSIDPQISQILFELSHAPKCLIARMSGSGGTCFALFADENKAEQACDEIKKKNPSWWCQYAAI